MGEGGWKGGEGREEKTERGRREECFPSTIVVGCVSVKLNNHWCQPSTGTACCASSGSPPNGGLIRLILDEFHQKEVIMYHFLPTHSVTVAHTQTVQSFTS